MVFFYTFLPIRIRYWDKFSCRFLLLGIFLLFEFQAYAQTEENYAFRFYDISNGLSSYNVRKIIQDKYGFIWIATQDGLNFFDGRSFKIFRNSGKYNAQIADNAVMDMDIQPDKNSLWICMPYKGIQEIDLSTHQTKKIFSKTFLENTLGNSLITAISFPSKLNDLWVGNAQGFGVFNIANKHLLHFEKTFGKEYNCQYVIKILHDEQGLTWVCTRCGYVYVYDTKTIKLLSSLDVSKSYDTTSFLVNDVANINDTATWLATSDGIKCLTYKKSAEKITVSNFPSFRLYTRQNIKAIAVDANKNFWFAIEEGLFKYNNNGLFFIGASDVQNIKWQSSINTMFCDRLNNLWIGSRPGLTVSSIYETPFKVIKQDLISGTSIEHAYNLFPLSDTCLLVAAEEGVYKCNNGRIFDLARGGGNCIFKGPDKYIIVSEQDGLFLLKNANQKILAEKIFPELKTIQNDYIGTSISVGDSVIIMGSDKENGIYWWNFITKKIAHYTSSTDHIHLGDNSVNSFAIHPETKEIIVGGDEVITLIDPQTKKSRVIKLYVDKSRPCNYFFDIVCIKDLFFIASYESGVIITDRNFKIKSVISTTKGLSDNGVYRIEAEGDSAIWVSTNNGLNRISIRTMQIQCFYEPNGLHGNSFEEFSSAELKDKIYMGGVGGVTEINPQLLRLLQDSMQFYFTTFSIQSGDKKNDSINLNSTQIVIPANAQQTTISFSALNYTNPNRVIYEYKIDELHKSWIDLGTQNFVNLIGLSPDTYTLEVKAANEDGVWCEPKSLTLTFLPKWYQTAWFKAAIILFVGGIFYAFYRYRITQLKKQQQIRHEIASDLHDDLGATLNSVRIFTNLAETSPKKEEYFQQIRDSINTAYLGLRDMIWVLDDTGDTVEDLLKRIKQFAQPVANANNIHVHFSADDADILELNKTEKRNLLLIAKEAINNCIKYANCKNIHVAFTKEDRKIKLVMKDDGCGFDEKEITYGHGLKNIPERAKQINYTASIHSEKGQGTTIVVMKK